MSSAGQPPAYEQVTEQLLRYGPEQHARFHSREAWKELQKVTADLQQLDWKIDNSKYFDLTPPSRRRHWNRNPHTMSFGATPEDKRAFAEMMKDPANKKCADCSAPNPQWANIHHGVFICLDCAGTHRGLGVHLSFVRSITMDKWGDWKPEKLEQMRKGGNAKALAFFTKEGTPGGTQQTIRARYNHIGAFKYRSKLEADVEGVMWSEANFQPPPEYNPNWDAPPKSASPRTGGYGGGGSRMGGLGSQPKKQDKSAIDEGMKAISGGVNKLGQVGWAGVSAVGDMGKKAADQARTLDTTTAQKTAQENWQKASTSASQGWGWLSSAVTKAAQQASDIAMGKEGGGDAFGSHLKSTLAHGPVGEGETILEGETVVWDGPKGPERAVVSAVDDRTDPPTFIVRLDDGGKRGAARNKLRKWSTFEAEKSAASPQAASPTGGAGEQSEPTPSNPNPFAAQGKKPQASPVAARTSPAPKKSAFDDDDWDDWGEDSTPARKKGD